MSRKECVVVSSYSYVRVAFLSHLFKKLNTKDPFFSSSSFFFVTTLASVSKHSLLKSVKIGICILNAQHYLEKVVFLNFFKEYKYSSSISCILLLVFFRSEFETSVSYRVKYQGILCVC